ncbi:unnamed protein product, partial [Allacma fusca]
MINLSKIITGYYERKPNSAPPLIYQNIAIFQAQSCPEGQVLCEGTENECIPEEFYCDYTYKDCSNDWDETDCPCPNESDFICDDERCIPESWTCDGYLDCRDETDEDNCQICRGYECPDGTCIAKIWVCNGRENCPGGEDEENCPFCGSRFFTCADNQTCILKS